MSKVLWDLSDDIELADRQHRLAVGLPSSNNNGLCVISVLVDSATYGSDEIPKLPQTSPLFPSSFKIAFR